MVDFRSSGNIKIKIKHIFFQKSFNAIFLALTDRVVLQRQRSHAEVQHSDPGAAQRHMMCDIKQVKHFIGQLGISKVDSLFLTDLVIGCQLFCG